MEAETWRQSQREIKKAKGEGEDQRTIGEDERTNSRER